MFPIYINKAAEETDPVERMKLFVAAIISSFYYMNMFSKPVNFNIFSLTPFLEKHWKLVIQMEQRSTVNK